mmetsp:Transcript_45970/g.111359  ORF Transcript_45970/g.111359 Transcript_45970/m.111359 type:complete len:355 (-) Transcript_45970:591-1655(-)
MESATLVNLIGAIVVVIMILGLTWVFYPAWLVAMASETKWTIRKDSEGKSTNEKKVVLSLVIPAYNEEERISIMLQSAHDFLQSTPGSEVLSKLNQCLQHHDDNDDNDNDNDKRTISVEWIVVDDGSADKTCEVVTKVMQSIHSKNYLWKIVSLEKNSGKGAAIKTGMSIAKGHYSLMVDADGATDFGPGLQNLVENLSAHSDDDRANMIAVFGSRAHLQGESTAKRSLVRSILMWAFHFFVRLLVSSSIQDTQCGFKLFDQQAARLIFGNLHLQRWAFDTEVVCLCDLLQVTMLEVAVPWQEIEGSKLSTSKFALAMASITMLRDMICVRLCYTLRLWTASSQAQSNSKLKSS